MLSFLLQVPCVAVVENMSFFEADGKRYLPFGQGSGKPAGWGCRAGWRKGARCEAPAQTVDGHGCELRVM